MPPERAARKVAHATPSEGAIDRVTLRMVIRRVRRTFAEFFRVANSSGVTWAASKALDHAGFPVLGLWPESTINSAQLHTQVASMLTAWGMQPDHVAITARHLLYADLHGIDSHGCGMLWDYHQGVTSGRLTMTPTLRTIRENASTALLDGGGGLGHVATHHATLRAIEMSRATGVGVVTVRNSGHFGAAGSYAAMASSEGMIGIVTTNNRVPSVVPTLGIEAKLGTNPIAFSAPAQRNRPFLLDMSTSTAPVGKLMSAWRNGQDIPAGWALDPNGDVVTDARRAAEYRRLTPLGSSRQMGSHKGYGLATMVEILSSVLPGVRRAERADNDAHARVGHCIFVVDPARFGDRAEFTEDMDSLLDSLRETKPVNSSRPVQVAGDPEYAAAERTARTGVTLSRAIVEDMRRICNDSQIPFLLDDTRTPAAPAVSPE